MGSRITHGGRRDLQTLWDIGAVASLTDLELIGRFTDREDVQADVAFAAVVDRHGPMVLATCRRLLGEPNDAEDAFQATFLVLARKAKSLRVRDTIGPWLYEVARRVALEARAAASRRRRMENADIDLDSLAAPEAAIGELEAALDEELSRLPENFRAAIVLCDFEGLTIEVAARQLGWPFGTVKSRLARGRERLRSRLARRGWAPAVAMGRSLGDFSATVPTALRDLTTRAAWQLARPGTKVMAVAPAAVATLTEGVLKTMCISRIVRAMTVMVAGTLVVAVGVGAVVWVDGAQPEPSRSGTAGSLPTDRADRALPSVITPTNVAKLKPISRLIARFNPTSASQLSQIDLWRIEWGWAPDKLGVLALEQPIEVRDADSLALRATIGKGKKIVSCAFSPRGNAVAYIEKGATVATIHNLRDGRSVEVETKAKQSPLAFSPDGAMLATGGHRSSVRLWQVEGGQFVREFDVGPQTGGGQTLEFSPDGRMLAVADRNPTTMLVEVETGKVRAVHGKWVAQSLKFHPQGHAVAITYADGSVLLWRVSDGVLLRERKTEADELYSVAWSPDGSLMATAGREGRITLWAPADLSVIHELEAPGFVNQVGFSPDGRKLYYAGGAGVLAGKRWLEVFAIE